MGRCQFNLGSQGLIWASFNLIWADRQVDLCRCRLTWAGRELIWAGFDIIWADGGLIWEVLT